MTTIQQFRTDLPGDHSEPTVSLRHVLLCNLAVLSAVAAVIHFAVSGEHFQEYWLFGAFMLGSGFAQAAWAYAAVRYMNRWLTGAGLFINGGIVVVYILTRTVGDMLGPTPNDVEPVGFGDAFCTALEAMIAAVCLGILLGAASRPVRARMVRGTCVITSVVSGVLLSVALVHGGPEMVMSGDAGAAPMHGTTGGPTHGMTMRAATTRHKAGGTSTMPGMSSGGDAVGPMALADTSPAGPITMPMPGMQMGAGMRMLTPSCTAKPTTAQQRAAVRLVDSSWKNAQPFRKLSTALAAGYLPITPTGLPVVHYLNVKYYLQDLRRGVVLATAKPQSLVYANTPHGAVLVASMYITSGVGATAPTPQPGGCLTQWHVHTNLCFSGLSVVGLTHGGTCSTGTHDRVTPPMMHVWYVPIPGGPTAIDASDAQIVRAAERVHAPANGTA